MVKIEDSLNKQSEVNRELDSYLKDRVEHEEKKHDETVSDFESEEEEFNEEKVPFYKKIFGGNKSEEYDEEDFETAGSEVKEIEEIEEEVEKEIEYNKEESTETKNKKSFFSKIFSIFSDDDDKDDEEEFNEEDSTNKEEKVCSVNEEGLSEDLKKLIKIQHKWINRLEPAALEEFKNSDDFSYYKDVLEKYGLIKK